MLNIKPRTIYCRDNLDILQGINRDCIDLIYLDPPFNKKKKFTALHESSAAGAEFSDIFREQDIKSEWIKFIEFENVALHEYLRSVQGYSNTYNYCYLVYMAIRLIECRRILKQSGGIYLHCDQTMSHYLKVLLDCIFGEDNFRNQIVWSYPPGGKGPKYSFHRKHDIIFYYGKSRAGTFNRPYDEMSKATESTFRHVDDNGRRYKTYPGGRSYLDESKGRPIPDWWANINSLGQTVSSRERVGYPTQKPLALLQRIIAAGSNAGDMVLDPFCGCATTCIAAEKLQRDWVGIDISDKTYQLVNERLQRELPHRRITAAPNFFTLPPQQTCRTQQQGYVYVISNPAFANQYKVGVARDVDKRLNSYQTSDPQRAYKVEYKLQTPLYREIETEVQRSFCCRHEWVQASLKQIIEKIKQYHKDENKKTNKQKNV